MSPLFPTTLSLNSYLPKREVIGEGGLITGTDPTAFIPSDPLRLWIIQAGIIIMTTQLLSCGLRRLRQPKVIAELLGGILLGPTAFGRIPGFTEHIFPAVSIPCLSLVANIGLCFFLFFIGLEVDINSVKRNARIATIISLAGIVIPFGLGSVLSVPLYHHFVDPSVSFTYFMLFTSVAYSITAFPVLCRVLTELRMLEANIGIVVLSAGVGNNIIGWLLLALNVALVNAGSGLSALWILLGCIAFSIFLLIPVKFVMLWLARKTSSTENGPTMFYMTVVMMLLWSCAFFTDCIGVNAIFGAFLAGLVIPREGGLAITLTEKLEDMVLIVFLPLYFAVSGLNTDLGLLNNGVTWSFTILIIVVSFAGKFGASMIASRAVGYRWRESSAIGALMSCKGLVELIVLNVGLQAGILSQRVFSMFVLEAVVLTLITTPLVTVLYPPEHRVRVGGSLPRGKGDECGKDDKADKASSSSITYEEQPWRHRFTVILDKLDHVPSAMALTQLLIPQSNMNITIPSGAMLVTKTNESVEKLKPVPNVDLSVEALRLVELSDRTSAMMTISSSSVADYGSSLAYVDPVLDIFGTFGELNEVTVTASLSIVPYDDFAESVAEHAQRHRSHLVLLPWMPGPVPVPAVAAAAVAVVDGANTSEVKAGDSAASKASKSEHTPSGVPFGNLVEAGNETDKFPCPSMDSEFVRGVFARSKTDVALFIDTGDRSGVRVKGPTHIFLPFFGGPDDRLALDFVVQLCLNPKTTATVVRMAKRDGAVGDAGEPRVSIGHVEPSVNMTRLQSDTADSFIWQKYATPSASDTQSVADDSTLRQALSRIHFSDAETPMPIHAAIRHARAIRETTSMTPPRLLIVAGRSKRLARESHHGEMKQLAEAHWHRTGSGAALEGMRRTIGDVGAAMVVGASASAVLVVQVSHIAVD